MEVFSDQSRILYAYFNFAKKYCLITECYNSIHFAECGDHPKHINNLPWKYQEKLGSVALGSSQDYTSCRRLCSENYPEFQYYLKFINYNSCDCMKLKDGYDLYYRPHNSYTLGFALECSNK